MADASYIQSNFQGGEWSPFMQGRMDEPGYRNAMNRSLNGHATEEGGWTRRPGFRRAALTRGGAQAALREFGFSRQQPYIMEFTQDHLRLFKEDATLLIDPTARLDVSFGSGNPMPVSTGTSNHGLTTGDEVQFYQNLAGPAGTFGRILDRQFFVTVTSDTTFTVPFDSSLITDLPEGGVSMGRITDFTTPYLTAELDDIRTVQDNTDLLILHASHPPMDLLATVQPDPANCVTAQFNLSTPVFKDGPYMDPPTTGQTITFPSALTGSADFTISSVDPTTDVTLASTDVGRLLRVLAEPPEFVLGDTYVFNYTVQYQGNGYTAMLPTGTGVTTQTPDIDTTNWTINPSAFQWSWATITAVTGPLAGTALIEDGATLIFGADLPTWRLGLYSDTTGWPSAGVYHEGRFVLANQFAPNRLDFSVSNDPFNFQPTAVDGTVADNNGISAVFNSTHVDPILWLVTDDQGIVCGTQEEEWLVRSTSIGDPITPTNIQVKKVSAYGTSDVEAIRVGIATLFVSRFNRKIYEFMGDVYAGSGKYSAINLALNSKHLTAAGIAQIAYQREVVPKLWLRMLDGSLVGITYKRDGSFSPNQQTGSFAGWHSNQLGTGRLVESITSGPTFYGLDTVWAATVDPNTGVRWVEFLTDIFGQNAAPTTAFFVDGGVIPTGSVVNGTTSISFYGFDDQEGVTLSAWIAGLDLGDYTVTDGAITVPFTTTFTPALLESLTPSFQNGDLYNLGIQSTVGGIAGVPPLPALGKLWWFDHPNTGVSGVSELGNIDWNTNTAIIATQGHGTGTGWRSFNIITGEQIAEVSNLEAWGVDDADHNASNSGMVDQNGNTYGVADLSNSSIMFKMTPGLVLTQWGSESENTSSGPDGLSNPLRMRTLSIGDRTYVVSTSNIATHEVAIIDANETFGWLENLGVDENTSLPTDSRTISNGCIETGEMYLWGLDIHNASPNTNPMSLYRLTGSLDAAGDPFFNINKIATYTPADFDPTWTDFGDSGGVNGFQLDQTDGNVLITVRGTTGQVMMAKLDTNDGSFLWRISGLNLDPSWSRITSGGFTAQPSNTIYNLDTIAGTFTTETVVGFTPNGPSFFDGDTGYLAAFGNFNAASGSPTPQGSTPTSFTSQYYTFGPGTPGTYAATIVAYPAVIGKSYASQGQLLRPIASQETGAQNGPALGKTRRTHQFAALLHRAGPVQFGTDFVTMRPAEFKTPGGNLYATGVLYDGLLWTTLEDDYTFDSQFAWQVTRPNPLNVLAAGLFLHTQDR